MDIDPKIIEIILPAIGVICATVALSLHIVYSNRREADIGIERERQEGLNYREPTHPEWSVKYQNAPEDDIDEPDKPV